MVSLGAHTGTDRTVTVMTLRLVAEHRAGGIVHRAYGITQEREPDAVLGRTAAIILHTAHTLVSQDIGIAVFQTAGMEGSVEVNHDVMLGSFLCHTVIEIYHPLVLTVHKVNLGTHNAPLLEFLEEIHVVLNCQPGQPYPDAYVLALGITDQLRQVHLGIGTEGVAGIQCPALVHYYIRYTVAGGKVHKVLISIQIDAALEGNILAVGNTVQPVPAGQTGLDPAGILNLTLLCQTHRHRILRQTPVLLSNEHIAPGEGACALCLGNIVSLLQDTMAAVALILILYRALGLDNREAVISITLQEESWIADKVELAEQNLLVLAHDEDGQFRHPVFRLPFVALDKGVVLLAACLETAGLLQHQVTVAGQLEHCVLLHYLYLTGEGSSHTEGHAIIVEPEVNGIAAFHIQGE